jgi:hypothetical protein
MNISKFCASVLFMCQNVTPRCSIHHRDSKSNFHYEPLLLISAAIHKNQETELSQFALKINTAL